MTIYGNWLIGILGFSLLFLFMILTQVNYKIVKWRYEILSI